MSWKIKSTWYRAPSLSYSLSDREVEVRTLTYQQWYKEKHGRDFDAQSQHVISDAPPRERLLRDGEIIGVKNGQQIIVRPITKAATIKGWQDPLKIADVYEFKSCAPSLYVVAVGGQRIDSFLGIKRARARALQILNETPAQKAG